jgi:hypothetical protein
MGRRGGHAGRPSVHAQEMFDAGTMPLAFQTKAITAGRRRRARVPRWVPGSEEEATGAPR